MAINTKKPKNLNKLNKSTMSNFKNTEFKITKDENFSFKITFSNPESLLIRCYDLKKLSNSCFENTLSKKDIENIDNEGDINKFYNNINTVFEKNQYEIINNNNTLIIKLNEKTEIPLKQNSISDINEYNNILCQSINSLKEYILNIQENLIKSISEISRENIKRDNEHESFNEKIKLIKEENITLEQKMIDLEKENENNKKEINSLKTIINKLSSQNKAKNYPKKQDLIQDYNDINKKYGNMNSYNNSAYEFYENLHNYYYPNSDYNINSEDTDNDMNENDYYDEQLSYIKANNMQNMEYEYNNNNFYPQNLNLINENSGYYSDNIPDKQFIYYTTLYNLKKNTEDDKNPIIVNSENKNNISSSDIYNVQKFNSIFKSIIKDKNIRKLDLGSKKIGNKILIELPKYGFHLLSKLYLSDNDIDNINDLVSFDNENLEKLYLSSNKIKDISVLSNVKLSNLNTLYLNNNLISDISVFSSVNFPHMKNLSLHSNEISNIDVLEFVNFKELQYLALHGNKINDISVFKKVKFPELSTLLLYNNKIKDLTVFDRSLFSNLKCFYIFGNCIDEKSNIKVIGDLRANVTDFQIRIKK